MGAGDSSMWCFSSNRLKMVWKRHKFRIVVSIVLFFLFHTGYDVYFTTKEQEAKQAQQGSQVADNDEQPLDHVGNLKKSMYETDPDLIWDD